MCFSNLDIKKRKKKEMKKLRSSSSYYFHSKALDMHIAVALLRIQEGLDSSGVITEVEEQKRFVPAVIPANQSFSQLSQGI